MYEMIVGNKFALKFKLQHISKLGKFSTIYYFYIYIKLNEFLLSLQQQIQKENVFGRDDNFLINLNQKYGRETYDNDLRQWIDINRYN